MPMAPRMRIIASTATRMEEMIDFCAQFVDEVNKNMPKPMTQEEYKQMMRQYFPMLKRWKSAQ